MGKKLSDDWILARGLRIWEQFMVGQGLDWKMVLDRFEIDPELGHQAGARLPIRINFALGEYAAELSGNDAAGFEMGSSAPVGIASTNDYVAIAAPSLRVGLQNWTRFNSLLTNAFTLHFEERDGNGYLEWLIPDRHGPRTQFLFAILSWAATRIDYITDDPEAEFIMEFRCPEPKSISDFQKRMGQRIRYKQDHDRIVIPERYLSMVHHTAESNLYRIVEETALAESLSHERSDDERFMISEQIGEALKNGTNTLENIASAMGMTPRTLHRKLAASGTNFRDLTDEIRKALATHYLTDTNLPLSEIAFLLGFSDLSAFSRSARNWFGVAPREYRRQRK